MIRLLSLVEVAKYWKLVVDISLAVVSLPDRLVGLDLWEVVYLQNGLSGGRRESHSLVGLAEQQLKKKLK